jgi:hypothetical protein
MRPLRLLAFTRLDLGPQPANVFPESFHLILRPERLLEAREQFKLIETPKASGQLSDGQVDDADTERDQGELDQTLREAGPVPALQHVEGHAFSDHDGTENDPVEDAA